MLKMIHQTNGGNWTRGYHYSSSNNYLLKTSLPGDTLNDSSTYSANYTYDNHVNMLSMPHLSSMTWDFADQLKSVDLSGGGKAYYVYSGGQRVRKIIEINGKTKDRIYLGSNEIYREKTGATTTTERETLHVSDDKGRITLIETKTIDKGQSITPVVTFRYQYGNHLQSASLELDENGAILTYEEYYPYGDSSYRLGKTVAEVSMKR